MQSKSVTKSSIFSFKFLISLIIKQKIQSQGYEIETGNATIERKILSYDLRVNKGKRRNATTYITGRSFTLKIE